MGSRSLGEVARDQAAALAKLKRPMAGARETATYDVVCRQEEKVRPGKLVNFWCVQARSTNNDNGVDNVSRP